MGNTPDDASAHSLSISCLQPSTKPFGSLQAQQSTTSDINPKGSSPEESVSLANDINSASNLRQPAQLIKEGHGTGDDNADEKRGNLGGSKGVDGMESDGKTSEEEPASRGSAESKTTQKSTAEDWFKDFNQEVQQNNAYLAYDDDPPYYLPNDIVRRKHHLASRHQRPSKLSRFSSVGPSAYRLRRVGASVDNHGQPDGGELDQQGRMLESTSESNSDSYRSVIDDLTVKNQKLKRRLRRLEELQAEHLRTDKLFELRIHGLSLTKRQELETLLQQFASTLHSSPSGSSGGAAVQGTTPQNNAPLNPAQSGQITDSGYASNSGSGGSSVAPPSSVHPSVSSKAGNGNGDENGNGSNGNGGGNGNGNGNSGGEISPPQVISEKVKMRLVVRRLEQLFTGRSSSFARSHQMETQTGITGEGDGTADNCLPQARGSVEGTREASLMVPGRITVGGSDTPYIEPDQPMSANEVGIDQRPTRPIDLDPRRAQIPEDNLEYLHNLTSSSAKESASMDGQWDGWVYLNLITNLAQLHTINVTPPFVKKAIATMSTKLELSPDGKMVRWRGGHEGSNLSSGSGSRSGRDSQSEGSPTDGLLDEARGRKRNEGGNGSEGGGRGNLTDKPGLPKSNEGQVSQSMESSTRVSSNSRSGSGTGRASGSVSGSGSGGSAESFHYKPLFAQSRSFDDDSSDMDTSSFSSSEMKSGSSYERTQTGQHSGDRDRKSKKPSVGPIIYYENGNFCTDLSAQEVEIREVSVTPDYPYERMTNQIVGLVYDNSSGYNSPQARSRPLFKVKYLEPVAEDTVQDSGESGESLDDSDDAIAFSPKLNSTLDDHPALPLELEVSGIGGVQPEDNFAINVQVKHYLLPKGNVQTLNDRRLKSRLRGLLQPIPQSSIDIFHREENIPTDASKSNGLSFAPSRSSPLRPRHKVIDERVIRLPPSALPPAGYMFFSPSSDDSSRDSDSGILPKSGSRSDYSAEMDTSMRDESIDSSIAEPRSYMEEMDYTPAYKGGAVGSVGSGKVVLGRARSRLGDSMQGSSAAVTGSVYKPRLGSDSRGPSSNDSPPVASVDSDQFMEDIDGAPDQYGKSSDDYVEDDEDDSEEQLNRASLKRCRGSKSSVDSILATRKV